MGTTGPVGPQACPQLSHTRDDLVPRRSALVPNLIHRHVEKVVDRARAHA